MKARAAGFDTKLRAVWLDSQRRQLLAPLFFYSAKFQRNFIVPEGFVTDLASVPRLPVIYWLFGGVADEAATLHDYLYTGVVSRQDADEVFAEAIAALQAADLAEAKGFTGFLARVIAPIRRGGMWAGVRVGGGSHYTPAPPGVAPDALPPVEELSVDSHD